MTDIAFLEINCIYPILVISTGCHIKDRYHVPVRHEHVHREVEYLCVQFEVVCNARMNHISPLIRILLRLTSVVADTIPPEVAHSANLELEIIVIGNL